MILNKGEIFFQRLVNNASDLFLVLSSEGIIQYCSPSSLRLLKYEPEEVVGTMVFDYMHKADIKKAILFFQNRLRMEGYIPPLEVRVLHRNNRYRHIEILASSLVVDPEVRGIIVNARDITERKIAHNKLQERKERLNALIESTNDSIWAVDLNFKYLNLNSSYVKRIQSQFGLIVHVGDHALDFFPEAMRNQWRNFYERVFGGARFTKEVQWEIKGKFKDFEISFNPILNALGLVKGAAVHCREITGKKNADRALKKTNFELDSFVYRSSHDLRSPIRTILGLTQIYTLEKEEQGKKEIIQHIVKSATKLDYLITDISNFSDNNRIDISSTRIDFDQLVDAELENLQKLPFFERLQVIRDFEDKIFFSDKNRLQTVFHSLISNAIKYQNKNITTPQLKISSACQPDGSWKISFEDNGVGIEAQYLDKVFDMFFKASADAYGSGLGLYVAKQIVEKLGGTLQVFSEVNKGSTFVVMLPDTRKQEVQIDKPRL